MRSAWSQSLRLPSPGFWLLMLTLLALLSVYFGPLLFAGKVEVYTANRVVRVVDDPCLNCDLDAQPLRFRFRLHHAGHLRDRRFGRLRDHASVSKV